MELLGGIQLVSDFPMELYHYTSIQALESIILSQTFWVTHSEYMNDKSEGIYFWDVLGEVIHDLRYFEIENKDQLLSLCLQIEKRIPDYQKSYFYTDIFMLSFSCDADSLSLWNYYGKNDGYCLHLDPLIFNDSLKKNKQNPLCAKVIYEKSEQKAILSSELRKVVDYFFENSNPCSKEYQKNIIDQLFHRWAYYYPFFKHSSFISEQEYRMVFSPDEFIKYRVYQGIMAPYIAIPLVDENNILPITEITVGPMVKHELALEGLRRWITSRVESKSISLPEYHEEKQGIKYTKSDIPLRF
ncbi:DUF2971 domain-containing protein [Paenibacillus sp. CFBP13512]|uniref:DUF2971 domain-containing protein n=1 Tax=Paenibacillus sp. CFBP13512 TaxID=2184007 RepID=UPI0013763E8E|nr:DUF2971 domain-containing protein [Paenibacillus sp. CFBP13512]